MRRARLDRLSRASAVAIPFPDQPRVAGIALGSRKLADIVVGPLAGMRFAEGRDAALGGHAATGEGDDSAGGSQTVRHGIGQRERHHGFSSGLRVSEALLCACGVYLMLYFTTF